MAYSGLTSLVPYQATESGHYWATFVAESGGYGKIVHGGLVAAAGVQLIAESLPGVVGASGRLEVGLVKPMVPGSVIRVEITREGVNTFARFFQDIELATVVCWKGLSKTAPEGRGDLLLRLQADLSPRDSVPIRVVRELHDPEALRARFSFEGPIPLLDDVYADLDSSVVAGPENSQGLNLGFFSTPEDLRDPQLLLFMRLGANLVNGSDLTPLLMAVDEVGMWAGAIATEPGVTGSIEVNFFVNPPEGEELVVVAARSEVQVKRFKDRVTSAVVPVYVLGGAGTVFAQARITFIPNLSAAVAGVMKRE